MTTTFSTWGGKVNTVFRNLLGGAPEGPAVATGFKDLGNMIASGLNYGQPTTFSLIFSSQPTTADTITLTGAGGLGTDKYEFVTAAGNVTTDGNIGVAIAGSAALTAANLVLAVNGLQTASGIFNTDGVTPAQQNGTLSLKANTVTSPSQTVHFVTSDIQGGSYVGAVPSITLAESITAAADVWTCGNVNVNTLGGRVPGQVAGGVGNGLSLTITTAMLTPKKMWLSAPFAITGFQSSLVTAAGLAKYPIADAITVTADGKLLIAPAGTGAPEAVNTDVYVLQVW